MKKSRPPTTQRWLTGAAATLFSVTASEQLFGVPWIAPAGDDARNYDTRGRFRFAYDHVLGTSLDVQLDATSARDARECEHRMLAEIDRLECILSIYQPGSEISRVRAGARVESPELAEILRAYEQWSTLTGGALSSNLADVRALWKEAARSGREPDSAALAAAIAVPLALNIDALGKAYIVDRVATVAREHAASGLLDIGGDIRAWGDATWIVGVANPLDPADNALPLVQFPLRDAAVATSGSYARNFTVSGRRYSHIVDPRTLRPADFGLSATVVARDCVTANALSTAATVLGATNGARLARAYGIDHLIVNASDAAARSGFSTGSGAIPARFMANPTEVSSAVENAWPAGFQVAITVALKPADGFRAKRPYVAVWVEDHDQKLVRTITVWGNGKYQPDLTKWWHASANHSVSRAVTRATRFPGAYTVSWDGRDDRGTLLPQGDYKIFVEINREHGHHVWESAVVSCRGEPGEVELRGTAESDPGPINYGRMGGQ